MNLKRKLRYQTKFEMKKLGMKIKDFEFMSERVLFTRKYEPNRLEAQILIRSKKDQDIYVVFSVSILCPYCKNKLEALSFMKIFYEDLDVHNVIDPVIRKKIKDLYNQTVAYRKNLKEESV